MLRVFPALRTPCTNECTRCSRDKIKRFSRDNSMDPSPVPPELRWLTHVEEILISTAMPMMSLYRLPLGQHGYSGHVVNLPQKVSAFMTRLPRIPSDLDVIHLLKEGASGTHKDFRVRRLKILCALCWLKSNNRYYHDVTLDEEALAQLPEDGEHSGLSTVSLPLNDDDHISNEGNCDDDTFMSGTFIPILPKKHTEQIMLGKALVSGRIYMIDSRQYSGHKL